MNKTCNCSVDRPISVKTFYFTGIFSWWLWSHQTMRNSNLPVALKTRSCWRMLRQGNQLTQSLILQRYLLKLRREHLHLVTVKIQVLQHHEDEDQLRVIIITVHWNLELATVFSNECFSRYRTKFINFTTHLIWNENEIILYCNSILFLRLNDLRTTWNLIKRKLTFEWVKLISAQEKQRSVKIAFYNKKYIL